MLAVVLKDVNTKHVCSQSPDKELKKKHTHIHWPDMQVPEDKPQEMASSVS